MHCPIWTVSQSKLMAFVAFRFICTSVVHKTVVKDLSGIRKQFVVAGIPFPDRDSCHQLNLILRGYKRLRTEDHSKKPLQSTHLIEFFSKLDNHSRSHNVRLYKAVLSIAFQGLMRVSEYAATTRSDLGLRTLRMSNLRFYPSINNVRTIELLLIRSKTNQFGICNEAVAFECVCNSGICAFHRLLEYINNCRSQTDRDDPLFVFTSGDILAVRDVNRLINKVCVELNLDKRHYSSHSMRSGGATALYLSGVPLDLIQKLGRWSPTGTTLQKRYLKPTPVLIRQLVQRTSTI
jgi:integrase